MKFNSAIVFLLRTYQGTRWMTESKMSVEGGNEEETKGIKKGHGSFT